MAMLGGHPFLVRLALYRISCQDITLEQLLKTAPTMQMYQLQRMGLVQLDGNEVMPRCNLYREYFRARLKGECR
jgi:serine/threonine-protein kinase